MVVAALKRTSLYSRFFFISFLEWKELWFPSLPHILSYFDIAGQIWGRKHAN
jgi:hypothetical protein